MAHIAHPQERPPLQHQLAAIRRGVAAVIFQAAGNGLAALLQRRLQITLHQAEPVAIRLHLVLGIHASDRVLTIHDGGNGTFDLHIGQQRLITAANRMGPVKDQLYMQPVIAQQDRIRRFRVALVAHEFLRLRQRAVVYQQRPVLHIVAAHIRMACALDRERFIEEHTCPRHNPRTMPTVIATLRRRRAHRIGAVKTIVKAAPTGICRVQRVTGVGDRHHQLRTRNGGNLRVHIRRLDLEVGAFLNQITDVLQEALIGFMIMRLVAVAHMPVVDLALQFLPLFEKRFVLRRKVADHRRKT